MTVFAPVESALSRLRGLVLGSEASAFATGDDSTGVRFLLTVWVEAKATASPDDQAMLGEYEDWRRGLERRGAFVLGGRLGGPETATTLRFRDGEIRITDGPFLDTEGFIAGIDVIRASDPQQATQVAATHPFAHCHAIEVEQFYTG